MKNIFKYFVVVMTVAVAAFYFAACAKNEYNGKGAGEIELTLAADYDGVQVDCPDGEVSGSGRNYTVKVKSLKRTDIVVSCKGYHTQTVPVYTKDFDGGVAKKSVTLEKRYNTLTLTVSGVADMTGVAVKSESENTIKETSINGKKIEIKFNDFETSGEIDKLSVECAGYYTYEFGVNASDFTDYSAAMKVNLLSESSKNASVTFINNLQDDEYYFYISEFDNLNSGDYVRLKSSVTMMLDKTKNYVVRYAVGGENRFYPVSAKDFAVSPYKTVRVGELRGISYSGANNFQKYVNVSLSQEVRDAFSENNIRDEQEIYQNVSVIDKDGNAHRVQNYDNYKFCIYGVKKGDEVRVVATNGVTFVSDYTTTLGDTLTVEKKIENNSELTVRFFDPYGNRLTADENLVRLYNGSSGFEHFDADGGEYVNATDVDGMATVSQDGKEIVIDWHNIMNAVSLLGNQYIENFGSYFYVYLNGRIVYLKDLFNCEYYDVIVRETYELVVDFKDVSGNTVTNLRIPTEQKNQEGYYETVYAEYDYTLGGYKVSFDDGASLRLNTVIGDGINEDIVYNPIEMTELIAFKDFFEYDAAGGYYKLTVTAYKVKRFEIITEGDALPSDIGSFYFSVGGDSVFVYYKPNSEKPEEYIWETDEISEKYIGKTFNVSVSDRNNWQIRYEASVTFTREMFESGSFTLNFTRIDESRNSTVMW